MIDSKPLVRIIHDWKDSLNLPKQANHLLSTLTSIKRKRNGERERGTERERETEEISPLDYLHFYLASMMKENSS